MARIRTIKPDFFKHEGLYDLERECGLPVRVAYAGLWTVADREGRFEWRPRKIKADVLPYDEVSFEQILNVLADGGFVVRYDVDGVDYGYIPTWKKHQVVNQREAQSTIPEPPNNETHVRAYAYNGVNIAPALRETILARDGYKCVRCGGTEDLTIDHIFPRSIGGTHAPTNLRSLCKKCNSSRPVAGQALLDDLARDGLTLEDMQRMCMHVQARVERKGTGREQEGEEEPPFVPPSKPTRKTNDNRATRLSADWQLPAEGVAYANERGFFDTYLSDIFANFIEHFTNGKGRNETHIDWLKTWFRWVRTSRPPNGGPVKAHPQGGGPSGGGFYAGLRKVAAQGGVG